MTSKSDVWPLYQRHAAQFDAKRGRNLFERGWLDLMLSHLPPAATVLDLGCGMGEPIARYLIETGCRVTGVDAAPALIALCRHRFPEHSWITTDMRGLDLGKRFDAVIAWNSLFHLSADEQRAIFEVFARHCAPAAALMFTSGPEAGESIGELEGEPLYHASLAPDEYRALLAGAGFEVIRHVAEDADCNGHTVWLARRCLTSLRAPA